MNKNKKIMFLVKILIFFFNLAPPKNCHDVLLIMETIAWLYFF